MTTADVLLDPYDYEIHEDPYPYYDRLRDEAPLYHNDELGFWALSRHADVAVGFRDSTGSRTRTASRSTRLARPARPQDHVVPGHGRPGTPATAALVSQGLHARAGSPSWSPASPRLAVEHLDVVLEQAESFDFVATSPASCRWTSSPSCMGVPTADRDELRRLADLLVHREEGVNDVPAGPSTRRST